MSTGPQRQASPDSDGQPGSPLSWLGRLRLFVPSICALLLVISILTGDDGRDGWRWAAVVGLLFLQVVSLAVHARSR